MLKWPLSILSKLGTLALIAYIAWLGWQYLGPRKPDIGPARQELADKVIPNIVEDLRLSREHIGQVALLHFNNDPTDYVTDTLRRMIEQRGVLNLRDTTVFYKARNLLHLRHPAMTGIEAAVAEGRKLNTQEVLYGIIHDFESYPSGSMINAEVNLAEVSTGKLIFTKRYNIETSPTTSVTRTLDTRPSLSWLKRIFAWMIIVLLLPVFTISFIRTMVRKESNKSNAFVLGVYTLVDSLLAWLLVGASPGSWIALLIFGLAVAGALLYNVRIMTLAVRLEEA